MPFPQNLECALQVEKVVQDHGAIPATIALLDGKLKVGLSHQELESLAKTGLEATKTSRRVIGKIECRILIFLLGFGTGFGPEKDGIYYCLCNHDCCKNGRNQGFRYRRNWWSSSRR